MTADISTSSNMNFDEEYYPPAIDVRMLTEDEWQNSDQPRPRWLGFIHDNKPYRLEEEMTRSGWDRIEKVEAPYLERAFLLAKSRSGRRTKTVIHATEPGNINSILTNNFNWRLFGSNVGRTLLGPGIYFTTIDKYNIHYALGFVDTSDKRIIETEIIYDNAQIRTNYENSLPDSSYDSLRTPYEKIIIKFEDSVALPLRVFHTH